MVSETAHALKTVDPTREGQLAAHSVVRGILFATLAVCVIVPHSFQIATFLLIALSTAVSLPVMKRDPWFDRVLLTYFVGAAVTAAYVWVGYAHGAPRPAVNQTLLVYILSPLMWMLIGAVSFQLWGIERVVRILIGFTWTAIVSVILFFYLFLTFGKESVEFLTEEANVNVSGGFAGATILVYGSLIFLSGAIFAQPLLVRNKKARIALLTLTVLTAITSGRSALILSVPVGFAVGLILRRRVREDRLQKRESVVLPMLGVGAIFGIILLLVNHFLFEVDLSVVLGEFFDELTSGGGSVRTDQAAALWDGFMGSYGIGLGHGVGVNFIRNTDFPWRYEVIPLATLVRVGVLGTLVYMSTFILYGMKFLERRARRELLPEDVYMVGGFIAVAMAAFTNPYIESFIFQWMYFLPVMSIAIRPLVRSPEAVAALENTPAEA